MIEETEHVLNGVMLILKHDDQATFATAYDTLYFGDWHTSYQKMTEAERAQMTAWGWFKDEDSWAKFV